jgi:hypothetical protein
MMKTIGFTLAAALCVCALSLGRLHAAGSDQAIAKTIQAAYDIQDKAFDQKDVAGFVSIYTGDYTEILKGGQKSNLEQVKNSLRQMLAIATVTKQVCKVASIKNVSDGVLATVDERCEVVLTPPGGKKPQDMVGLGVFEDLWVKTDNGWMDKRSTLVTDNMTLDGKPVPG